MLQQFIDKLFGSYNDKQIKKLQPMVEAIKEKEEEYQKLREDELKDLFAGWRKDLTENPKKVDEYLIDVFAGIKNASRRLVGHEYDVQGKTENWQMVHYDVQLVGGIVLHQGKVAEMKTGEGKTLVSTLPIILNALTGRGVHGITVNDYLAVRDAAWMKPLYDFCGVSIGVVVSGITNEERKQAYQEDITLGTNNEFGFDYLRDNMAQRSDEIVQRDLYYAIIDEVDSILIDEARTPLIISAPAEESTDKYSVYAKVITQLKENEHYNIDYKQKSVHLSEEGVSRLEEIMGIDNFFTEKGQDEVHHIENALKANVVMKRDQDYVVNNGEVIIVDEFTGRMMPGRRFSDGLHQAMEAKENVEIQRESKTLATVTFQNYFRLYEKLAGMTGTAETEAEEFAKIYKLDTLIIPPNRPIARQDLPDKIFKNERGKFTALAQEVKRLNEIGQPVLVGTVNIDKSEALSLALKKEGIKHEVLNAKHHEREAEIISQAGQKGAVTIATNMAGRGTDIKLTEEVKVLGGLSILGTERHESRRIDNQLRGRAGRQGDPGFSQFYVAMTDSLMVRFGGEKMGALMERLGLDEAEAIENRMISRSVENAQKKIEGFHFDARKHVVQYDDVMNIHREKMYARRRKFLGSDEILEEIEQMIKDLVGQTVDMYAFAEEADPLWDVKEIYEIITTIVEDKDEPLTLEELEAFHYKKELQETLENYLLQAWDKKRSEFPEEKVDQISKHVMLKSVDQLWLEHIDSMTSLKDRVALSGYAQKDPVMEYKAEAFRMFSELIREIRNRCISNLFRVEFVQPVTPEPSVLKDLQTNASEIEGQLEDTAEFSQEKINSGLTRQQKREFMRKNK